MDATTMHYNHSLNKQNARQTGYKQQLIRLEEMLAALYYDAEENFTFQREKDPYYEDPATDYLLGKREATTDLIVHVRKALRGMNQ